MCPFTFYHNLRSVEKNFLNEAREFSLVLRNALSGKEKCSVAKFGQRIDGCCVATEINNVEKSHMVRGMKESNGGGKFKYDIFDKL
jgi:hypothetical protein